MYFVLMSSTRALKFVRWAAAVFLTRCYSKRSLVREYDVIDAFYVAVMMSFLTLVSFIRFSISVPFTDIGPLF